MERSAMVKFREINIVNDNGIPIVVSIKTGDETTLLGNVAANQARSFVIVKYDCLSVIVSVDAGTGYITKQFFGVANNGPYYSYIESLDLKTNIGNIRGTMTTTNIPAD